MAGRAREAGETVLPTMFPFLSVLVCMIGVMLFLALAVAPLSLGSASGNVELFLDSGSEQELQPVYLECDGDTARSLDGTLRFSSAYEDTHALWRSQWSGTPFTDFLDTLPKQGRYVLFLVRPGGIDCYLTLRAIVYYRNFEKCRHSVSVHSRPDTSRYGRLPYGLRAMLDYERSEGELCYMGVLTAADRDTLQALFNAESDSVAIQRLFERSQQTAGYWANYGSELVPAGWKVSVGKKAAR